MIGVCMNVSERRVYTYMYIYMGFLSAFYESYLFELIKNLTFFLLINIKLTGWVTTMPIIVLASRLCPEGMEGTIYALIMSINNMGGIISSQIGAVLTMYVRLCIYMLQHAATLCNAPCMLSLCGVTIWAALLPLKLALRLPCMWRHCTTQYCAATTHCNTLQHTVRSHDVDQQQERHYLLSNCCCAYRVCGDTAIHCNKLQHAAPHCTTLQHTATHCNTLRHTAIHHLHFHNVYQHHACHCFLSNRLLHLPCMCVCKYVHAHVYV